MSLYSLSDLLNVLKLLETLLKHAQYTGIFHLVATTAISLPTNDV